jgi:hypothetical protein
MAIVGTPGVAIFANDHAITTTPSDTAYAVSATAAMAAGQFRAYSITAECEFAGDGSRLRFGEDLLIEGSYPSFRVQRHHPDATVDLRLTATDKVSYFVNLVGGLYSHWSLLCRYTGTVGGIGVSGLCTFEYARGIGAHSLPLPGHPNLPTTFFTYQVINIDDTRQLLLTEVLGPRGLVLARAAYLRGTDDYGTMQNERLRFHVDTYASHPIPTPAGKPMRLPQTFSWIAHHAAGSETLRIQGEAHNDWTYGLGAGFVGNYHYTGHVKHQPIAGTGYIEYIDLR